MFPRYKIPRHYKFHVYIIYMEQKQVKGEQAIESQYDIYS